MSRDELLGTYTRPRQELAQAYGSSSWNEGLIDRLANDINRIEHSLTSGQLADEQIDDVQLEVLPLTSSTSTMPSALEG